LDNRVSILIVDDAVTYRIILKNVIGNIPQAKFVGFAQNGMLAINQTKQLKPDLILLDIDMPGMDGFETLKKIREFDTTVDIVIVSGQNEQNAKRTLTTLEHGALDFIPKPVTDNKNDSETELFESLIPVINAVQLRKATGKSSPGSKLTLRTPQLDPFAPKKSLKLARKLPKSVDVVLIGISTGGPRALQDMIPTITPNLPCPLLIVMHMPPIFTKQLANKLNDLSKLNIKEAIDGDTINPRDVLIAPGGSHMMLKKDGSSVIVSIVDTPPVNNCKPSVDVLFESAAKIYGTNALPVIMTGMGRDGANGVRRLRENGAYCLIQDEKSCTVWGMPAAIKEAEDYDEEVPLRELGQRISQIVLRNPFYKSF